VEAGEAQAVVSAGHSGAVMAGALLVLGRVRGIKRPALAAQLPALVGTGRCLLLDAGANVDCTPAQLAQFDFLGDLYARRLLGAARPRVALLSNGEEAHKGTRLTREAAALLRRSDVNFVGYAEGKDIFSGEVDVVATDGFTGNVVLKTSEGAAMGVTHLLRSAVDRAGLPEKLGAMLLQPTFAALERMVDYAEVGGAPLLGVDGATVVAHGRSSPRAIRSALKAALELAESQFPSELAARIGETRR
jgi:glycerol-3-phosphate acyltransferase PlsX